MDANKTVEVNEVLIPEWQKHECLWDVPKSHKARAYMTFKCSSCRQETNPYCQLQFRRNWFFHCSILFGS